MFLGASYKKKLKFFSILKVNEEKRRIRSWIRILDPLVRGTDPGIRTWICTKMSRIPNTDLKTIKTVFPPSRIYPSCPPLLG
jgi:hypothetical protein